MCVYIYIYRERERLHIYIYIYALHAYVSYYALCKLGPRSGPAFDRILSSQGLFREFTKGGLVQGGLAIDVLLLRYYC